MLLSVLAFVAVTIVMLFRTRAMRIRDRVEMGMFSGLSGEIEGLWDQDVIEVEEIEKPTRRAA